MGRVAQLPRAMEPHYPVQIIPISQLERSRMSRSIWNGLYGIVFLAVVVLRSIDMDHMEWHPDTNGCDQGFWDDGLFLFSRSLLVHSPLTQYTRDNASRHSRLLPAPRCPFSEYLPTICSWKSATTDLSHHCPPTKRACILGFIFQTFHHPPSTISISGYTLDFTSRVALINGPIRSAPILARDTHTHTKSFCAHIHHTSRPSRTSAPHSVTSHDGSSIFLIFIHQTFDTTFHCNHSPFS